MHFTRLRLQGFKSFVDQTELRIDAGLTGIVGPNGCGKSNLVEALKWVMGETSAKRMRGADMDDVIFAGTATRPSRNVAEVALELDNTTRTAMAEFNNDDLLMVARKIERGSGSDYRVNGRPVRLRDVQLLFADQSTGAHSTSVVGQGQIDALIRAKPQERRQILEEASGTAGLQARRHEAELKLKAAEQNLSRVDDVQRVQDAQLKSLKQQVRQASRYRNLADHIRRTEAGLLHLRWQEALEDDQKVKEALTAIDQRVAELTSLVLQGETARTEGAAALPSLRQNEAIAAAAVQKLTLAREQIDSESRRIAGEIEGETKRLADARADIGREESRQKDGLAALERLSAEEQEHRTHLESIAVDLPTMTQSLDAVTSQVDQLEANLSAHQETAAQIDARQKSLDQEIKTLMQRKSQLAQRRAELDAQRASLAAAIAGSPDLAMAQALVDACEKECARRQQQMEDAEKARRDAQDAQNAARDATRQTSADLMRLRTEAETIAKMLAHADTDAQQILDLLSVEPGFEKALAVALGEALSAALDADAAMHWRTLPPLQAPAPLPAGATALAQFIKAPPALDRALSQIGLVATRDDGMVRAESLAAGQILVSRDGWAWRWDGFTVSPEAKTATALRLQQRNRLLALESEIKAAAEKDQKAQADLTEATSLWEQCQTLDRETREQQRLAFKALDDARANFARQEREATTASAKITALDDTLRALVQDQEQVRLRAVAAEAEHADLPDIFDLREAIATERLALAESRSQQAGLRSDKDRLSREQKHAMDRLTSIAAERQAWQDRLQGAGKQVEKLSARIKEHEESLAALAARPAELQAQRSALLTELSDAEALRRTASDTLIAAEQKLSVIEHKLKQDENALGSAREDRVRAEAAIEAATAHQTALTERMQERLSCGPDELLGLSEHKDGEDWPSLFEIEQTLGRYVRERDNMGPVNLRAEVEAEAIEAEMAKIQQEKDDLTAAIAKLRQGISQLNREARERLQGAFGLVNERFQTLFKSLFGGGKAYLELVDNEDPLNAGLEIFASPPGKKMQILSLLSGGERTLTALALLFAVFQTNPSPICVLDEAEAALDESNIDRFCKLVSDISQETGTRFLIITHQRVTMAHMNRLYGVTMSEKGVSQLVSVDLTNAVALRDGKKIDLSPTDAAEEALAEVQAA